MNEMAADQLRTLIRLCGKVHKFPSNVHSGTGKKAKVTGFSAGKTGTSQDNRDAWFVGFDDDLICAVWLGNDNDSPMKGVSGSNLPAEIWRKIIQK